VRTTKPIATISFNTPAYLELKLNELLKAGRVSFWAFIEHKPEDDEGGKKAHCHVYIEPSKMLQTDDIKSELKEYDPEHPELPRGCITFKSSKFDPWYLYSLHDKRYLASKGQSRRYHYLHEDIRTSDPDDLLYKARSIDLVSLSPYADMEDAQRQGFTWAEYFSRGTIPLPQVALFERAWNLLLQVKTERADREGHPMDIYPDPDMVDDSEHYYPEDLYAYGEDGFIYDRVTGEQVASYRLEKPPQSPQNAPLSPKSPSWYEVHPQGDFVSLDPDEELPW
jgi:hypothetical protein